MRKSRLFTNSEVAEIEKFKQGDRSDKKGIMSARIRPKINEMIVFLKDKKTIDLLMRKKSKKAE